jgi:hypothetical protein
MPSFFVMQERYAQISGYALNDGEGGSHMAHKRAKNNPNYMEYPRKKY